MLHYSTHQLASIIAIPIITILLFWTLIIFQKNRKRWDAYDIPIVCLLILSILRNISVLAYTLLIIVNRTTFNLEYCSVIIWIFNSIHTFQASSLTTIAIIGLLSAKLRRKQQNLRQFLTATHVVYHLFCLTTLCACVGVAAILAQNDHRQDNIIASNFDSIHPCRFMPFDLDLKFNVFIIVLHVFLAMVSLISFVLISYNYFKAKKTAFDYLKKSNSDLSEFSVGLTNTLCNDGKNYYDTYTINRNNANDFYENAAVIGNTHFQNTYGNGTNLGNKDLIWNSDMSNFSTTVSSTNSRRPCISKHMQEEPEEQRTGLETIHPVLIVCYLFYHLPIIVLCMYPKLVRPWPVVGAALWLGLLQDLLIPIGLGIVDSRFSKWVSNVYRCNGKHFEEKLPQGLNGKFRPFGNISQPQSLEIIHQKPQQERNVRAFQSVEHRFPITNGSLYTSIDGRLPVIHNYRRHHKTGIKTETLSKNVALHSNHLKQVSNLSPCANCEMDSCPSHSNLHHLSPHYMNKRVHHNNSLIIPNRMSMSQENLNPTIVYHRPNVMKTSRNLVRLNRMRLSKSEDSLSELQVNKNPISPKTVEYTSSEDEFIIETNNDRSFDSLSSKSCYSITTEANGDFEFYQNKSVNPIPRPYINKPTIHNDGFNYRITRSNSKQSLENLQAFITEGDVNKLQRSNSYMTLEDRKRSKQRKHILRSNSKLSDCTHNVRQKIKSVEYLPTSNSSTVYIEDVAYYDMNRNKENAKKHVGSVPDFKKIFISEYI